MTETSKRGKKFRPVSNEGVSLWMGEGEKQDPANSRERKGGERGGGGQQKRIQSGKRKEVEKRRVHFRW